ncbi:cell division protein DrpB [Erwinia sp. HR93]|uniref:cell division protein DrpB n=1 Tax=Erwinia sp. HR93 TaxID=3094840 RepID=UPI002ADECEC6|nr:cell division protein DrpB [Erwinia sp. HR93]MEA1065311.1 cell division protein DrpB [Erwinia sp. HR93]
MEEKPTRGLGGRLALWAFYACCCYFLVSLARYLMSASSDESDTGSNVYFTFHSLIHGAAGALFKYSGPGLVAVTLGMIAWYTRPRGR